MSVFLHRYCLSVVLAVNIILSTAFTCHWSRGVRAASLSSRFIAEIGANIIVSLVDASGDDPAHSVRPLMSEMPLDVVEMMIVGGTAATDHYFPSLIARTLLLPVFRVASLVTLAWPCPYSPLQRWQCSIAGNVRLPPTSTVFLRKTNSRTSIPPRQPRQ